VDGVCGGMSCFIKTSVELHSEADAVIQRFDLGELNALFEDVGLFDYFLH